jgi:hypothetical protein
MQSMNEVRTAIKHEVLAEEFSQILTFIQTGYQQGYTAHEVESGLWQRMLKPGQSHQAQLILAPSDAAAWLLLLGDSKSSFVR